MVQSSSTSAPPFAPTFERLVAKVGEATPAARMAELHRAFEERTGGFGPDDPWFEVRSRAFWDDTMTREAGSLLPLDTLSTGEMPWALALARPHRGLFHPVEASGPRVVVSDLLSGAAFVVSDLDAASRDALASTAGVFDGTVVALASPVRVALLPGAIFHPEGTEDAIARVVATARARAIGDDALLDALLRMELSLRTLSRVKPSYAYRAEALPGS